VERGFTQNPKSPNSRNWELRILKQFMLAAPARLMSCKVPWQDSTVCNASGSSTSRTVKPTTSYRASYMCRRSTRSAEMNAMTSRGSCRGAILQRYMLTGTTRKTTLRLLMPTTDNNEEEEKKNPRNQTKNKK
jgi:hypothetical protein